MQKNLRTAFGPGFTWGVATSAIQTEGASVLGGRHPSIWDTFAGKPFRIARGDRPDGGNDFYFRFREDIRLTKSLGFDAFRFSVSWSRFMQPGNREMNPRGALSYHRIIDACLEEGLEPWLTVYHWDLPEEIERAGGWTQRSIIDDFNRFIFECALEFGDKVRNWIVMNEPMGFTALGYLIGMHAPGRMTLKGFTRAVHHAAICQAEGGRILKENVRNSNVGTALSFACIEPVNGNEKNLAAAKRLDAVLNRLFIEPILGMGYPADSFHFLNRLNDSMHPGDQERLAFNFDFIGVQYYFRYVVRHHPWIPLINAWVIPARSRQVPRTALKFESYPKGVLEVLRSLTRYKSLPPVYITESGACFKDKRAGGTIEDHERTEYHQEALNSLQTAIEEGIHLKGYFVWTLADNFEWNYGYSARFGLVYVDRATQQRIIKDSGFWFKEQLDSQ